MYSLGGFACPIKKAPAGSTKTQLLWAITDTTVSPSPCAPPRGDDKGSAPHRAGGPRVGATSPAERNEERLLWVRNHAKNGIVSGKVR